MSLAFASSALAGNHQNGGGQHSGAGFKILMHFTDGPGIAFRQIGGLPTESMSGPRCQTHPNLCAPNSDVGLGVDSGTDCTKMTQQQLTTSQTGGVCQAVLNWERIIKDDVTLNFEAYAIGLFANILGAAIPKVVTIPSPNLNGEGYNKFRSRLITDEMQEKHRLGLVKHLPNFNQITYEVDDIYPDGWAPQSLSVTSAQARALGYDPEQLTVVEMTQFKQADNFSPGLTGIDGAFTSSALLTDSDFNPSDGIGDSPVTLAQWDALDVMNDVIPFTIDPEFFDYVGIATHELGHVLGFLSAVTNENVFLTVDDYNNGFFVSPTTYSVTPMDLFMVKESNLDDIDSCRDFKLTVRNWKAREGRLATDPFDSTISPIEPELGNIALIYDVKHQQSQYIPMAGGGDFTADRGDKTSNAHSRSSFQRERQAGVLQNLTWLEDRCPANDPSCDPIVGDPNHVPSGRLMDPISVGNKVDRITTSDAVIMDLIGYDIDYSAVLGGEPSLGNCNNSNKD